LNKDEIKQIVATPRCPVPGQKVEEPEVQHAGAEAQVNLDDDSAAAMPQEMAEARLPRPMTQDSESREIRIANRMLENYGYSTEGASHTAHANVQRKNVQKHFKVSQ